MRRIVGGFVFAGLILFAPALAQATIRSIRDDTICNSHCFPDFQYPLRRGQKATITLIGDYVDLSTAVEVTGSGVTVQNIGTASSSKTIQFTVAGDAAPGVHSVRLRYLVETNGPDRFVVVVLRNGSIGNISVPTPTQPFTSITATITGTNIDNVQAFDMEDNYESEPSVGTNTPTEAKVNFNLRNRRVRVNRVIRLADKSSGLLCKSRPEYCYQKASGGVDIAISAVGPNFVSSVKAGLLSAGRVEGNSVTEDNVLTIQVGLGAAAESRDGKLFWQITPANSFVAAPGSNTTFSPSGVNSITVPAGQTSHLLSVKFETLPPGCPLEGCVGQVQAKLEGETQFVIQTFKMIPGRPASPANQPRIPPRIP